MLTVLSGIGDIKKQDFSRVSFWVQLHEVPLICMEKETAAELGATIRKVEEVETNSSGECIGKFLRMRISVDITKLLKKVVVLGHMEKEVDDGANGSKVEDIPMLVYYERLLDFCFCCERIRHQSRECVHYKSQSEVELVYGPWLKATTMAERLKQSRGNDRWNMKSSQPNTEAAGGVNAELIPISASGKQ